MKNETIVIYHGGCRDGFCAAWIVNRFMKRKKQECDFFAGYYGQSPPDCWDLDVIMVDFSYPLAEMERIIRQCRTLLVLDHHKTAMEALRPLQSVLDPALSRVRIIFDMDKSGAQMAWDAFACNTVSPYLVPYIEDRDLWRHRLPESKTINAYIGSLPFTFKAWDDEYERYLDEEHRLPLREGAAVLAKVDQYVAVVRKNALICRFMGHSVPVVNASQVDISELLEDLLVNPLPGHQCPFSVGWWQRQDGMLVYSMRSVGDFDVSDLAKKMGGGGHKNAAGFESPVPVHVWGAGLAWEDEKVLQCRIHD